MGKGYDVIRQLLSILYLIYVKKEMKRCFSSQTNNRMCRQLCSRIFESNRRFSNESGNSNAIGMRSGSRTRECITCLTRSRGRVPNTLNTMYQHTVKET